MLVTGDWWLIEHNFGKLLGEPNLMIRNLKQEAGEVTTADGSPLDFGKPCEYTCPELLH